MSTVAPSPDASLDDETRTVIHAELQPAAAPLGRGTSVGRYVVIDVLGQGGMGIVYRAHDPDLGRQVAIKLLAVKDDGGPRACEMRDRLVREAQALAQLSHPHVVAVHDVGVTTSGVFMAMEFVEGLTVDAWAKQRQPSFREMLDVLVQAGEGLAAAHRAGIVHRDFKPSNVIVGDDGRVRVLDFGISRFGSAGERASGSSRTDDAIVRRSISNEEGSSSGDGATRLTLSLSESKTAVGHLLGTPGFMPLEQILGQPLDARADIFSFCASAWLLFYGERPYGGKHVQDNLRRIRERDLTVPAKRRGVPSRIERMLRRGLEPHPDQRPPTMDVVLTELRRDPARTVRRVGWASAAAFACAGVTAGWLRAGAPDDVRCEGPAERVRATLSSERSAAIAAAFERTGRPYAADTKARVDKALSSYAERWVAVGRASCEATVVRGEQSDALFEARARCLDRRLDELAALVETLGSADAEVLDNAVEAASGLTPVSACEDDEALLAATPLPEDPEVAARVQDVRSRLDRARAVRRVGRFDAVLQTAREASADADAIGYEPLRVEAHIALAELLVDVGEFAEGRQTYQRAVELAARAGDAALEAQSWIGWAWVVGQALAEPQEVLRLRWAIEVAVLRADDDPDLRRMAALNLGTALENAGEYEAAEALFTDALEEARERYGDDAVVLAGAYNAVGRIMFVRGRNAEALAAFSKVVELNERALGPDHPDVAVGLNNVGGTLLKLGRFDEAQAAHERAIGLRTAAFGTEHPLIAGSLHNLGRVHEVEGRLDEANALYERSVAMKERTVGPEHPMVALTLNNLANIASVQGRPDDAKRLHERALGIRERALGPKHAGTAESLYNLATTLFETKEFARAAELHTRAISIWEASLGMDAGVLRYPLVGLARCYVELGQRDRAAEALERAVAMRQAGGGPDPAEDFDTDFRLAKVLWDSGHDRAKATAIANELLATLDADPSSPGTADRKASVQRWLAERTE